MTKTNVMVDLETLGNRPGSVIVSIGAVRFDINGLQDSFYERIDAQSCVDAGLTMDASTVLWWIKQGEEARVEITNGGSRLSEVLFNFAQWIERPNEERLVWGNGATFDNVLLSCAYGATGQSRPWAYSGDRCYRTIKNLYPSVKVDRFGVAHNALDDARSQAKHLIEIAGTFKFDLI